MTYLHSIFKPRDMALALAVDCVIRNRRTRKVLGHLHSPATIPHGFTEKVEEAVRIAGWAPFHFPANKIHRQSELDSCVPWRFYALDQASCLTLAQRLLDNSAGNVTEDSTIIRMLAAAGSVVLSTWLPEPKTTELALHMNEEHLAAASAAVQNLLLAGEARGIQTYWSSGGVLASSQCFDLCNIPTTQKLLGAIFMFPPQTDSSMDVHEGKLRNRRGTPDSWRTWISLDKQQEEAA
jgi:nitroreductase